MTPPDVPVDVVPTDGAAVIAELLEAAQDAHLIDPADEP